MMKNIIVIGIVVAMAVGFVITGSTPTAISAQGNLTSGGENTTAGGGDIVQQLKSAAVAAELIDNKKMFIIACEPSMTDPDTQCVVGNLEMR
jgi:tetrahydromethanopterin S-methyltransferase subunit D